MAGTDPVWTVRAQITWDARKKSWYVRVTHFDHATHTSSAAWGHADTRTAIEAHDAQAILNGIVADLEGWLPTSI